MTNSFTRRTKRDVKRLAQNTEFIGDQTTEYGCVDMSEMEGERRDRVIDHEWVTPNGELLKDGKAVLTEWNSHAQPMEVLMDIGTSDFIEQGRERDLSVMEFEERTYKNIPVKPEVPETCPTGHEDYKEREIRAGKTELDVMGFALSKGNHVHLKGETGTGKTMAAKHLAQQTNHGVRQVNFSEEVRMSYLFGHYEVHEGNKGGTEMQWKDGELTKAVRNGEWFIADEGNMMSGDVSSALHSATEKGNAKLTIPEKGEVIDVHDDFRLIMTSNPRYAGTKQVQRAFGNRFHTIKFDYLDENSEVDIVMNNTELDISRRDEVMKIVKTGRELREDYLKGEISQPITPRTMIRAAEFLEGGFMDAEDATKTAMIDTFPEEDRSPVEKTIEMTI